MSSNDVEQRKKIRRTTIIVAAIAIAIYLGFILSGVLRA
jgi:hypothetical protein